MEGWLLQKRPVCAQSDVSFFELAEQRYGQGLVAHVRQRTVGPVSFENTHPFRCGRWIFTHNGTIDDIAYLRSRLSAACLAEVRGSTDSELLFAFLLTRLDSAGINDASPWSATDLVIAGAVDELARRSCFGSYNNFVLCDGATLYAHCRGRSMFLLELGDVGRGTIALVASEAITDEPWQPMKEGSLVRCRRADSTRWHALRDS